MVYIQENAVLCLLALCRKANREDLYAPLSEAWRNYGNYVERSLKPVTAETTLFPRAEGERLLYALAEYRRRGETLDRLYNETLAAIEARYNLINEQAQAVKRDG